MTPEHPIPTRLRRAGAILPSGDRDRFLAEWTTDWQAAITDTERRDIEKGSLSMAVRLRARSIGRTLFGGRGPVVAAVGWALVMTALVLAGALGGPAGILLLAGVVALFAGVALGGLPTHASHTSMVAGVVLGLACTVYIFAAINVGIDASDSGRTAPGWTDAIGAATIGIVVAAALFVIGAVAGYRRRGFTHES